MAQPWMEVGVRDIMAGTEETERVLLSFSYIINSSRKASFLPNQGSPRAGGLELSHTDVILYPHLHAALLLQGCYEWPNKQLKLSKG